MEQNDEIYALTDVAKRYGSRTVVEVARLSVRRGEVLALVGPSGAGKSTLLRLLAFLERPTAGAIAFEGRTTAADWPDLAARRRVGMVFQRPQLLKRSVRDNVRYPLQLRGERVNGSLDGFLGRFGLEKVAGSRPSQLSGGEMQRVALARTLITRPDVLLLDEPTANLDPTNIKLIEQIVMDANAAGTTVVIVTHNIFQARRLANRVGLLLEGKLIEIGETETFFERPERAETGAFLRGELVY